MSEVTISGDRGALPDGADPLILEAAAGCPATKLCRAAFNAILNGELAAVSELAASTGASAHDVEQLVGRALIVDDNGSVVAAHGLSAVPARQHRLTLRGRSFWTWCAIDALGIPAGLGEDAVAETTCQLWGTPVRVELEAGKGVAAERPQGPGVEAPPLRVAGTAAAPHR